MSLMKRRRGSFLIEVRGASMSHKRVEVEAKRTQIGRELLGSLRGHDGHHSRVENVLTVVAQLSDFIASLSSESMARDFAQ